MSGFKCPLCGKGTRVLETRELWIQNEAAIYRRRQCPEEHRFTTYEVTVVEAEKYERKRKEPPKQRPGLQVDWMLQEPEKNLPSL